MMPMGGTQANIPLDDALKEAVLKAAENSVRAVKVVVESKPLKLVVKETLPATTSFTDDLETLSKSETLIEADVPCIVLMRLKDEKDSVKGAGDADWGLLSWMPDNAPIKQKMLCTSSSKTIKDSFDGLRFKEIKATDRTEISIKDVLEKARGLSRGMTKDERHAVMSIEEITAEEVRESQETEARAAPKMLAGLVALQIRPLESFEEAMKRLLSEDGKCVLAHLVGAKREELSGEVLDDAGLPTQLKGRLPKDEPCYVIQRKEESRLLLMTWLPEATPARLKMTCSTFKKSVVQVLKEKLPEGTVITAEVTDEDDLRDDIGHSTVLEGTGAASTAEAQEQPARKPGGFKPPVGGFALPGFGPPRG